MRMPYHIHVIPFKKSEERLLFGLFRRSDIGIWQGIVGGGESGESPVDTAIRESDEEAQIKNIDRIYHLDTITTMPAYPMYDEYKCRWGDTVVIPMYYFTIEYNSEIIISEEHSAFRWVEFGDAIDLMEVMDQRVGLWEIDYRLKNNTLDREMPNWYLKEYIKF